MNHALRRAAPALALLLLAACGSSPEEAAPTDQPTAPSSEWVQQNPTEPAVPVNLPDTVLTPAPAEQPSEPAK